VYAVLLACAVYFPGFKIVFIILLVPIRVAAVVIFGGMILVVLSGLARGGAQGAMSDVAHLGGAVAAAFWIWALPRLGGTRLGGKRLRDRLAQKIRRSAQKIRQGAWERKMNRRRREQQEIDRILDKVHREGIGGLTRREKKVLQDATRRQREQERDIDRM
jgi:hypothetical protein